MSRDLEAICLKAMSRDPDRRYASMVELGEDLDRFLAGEPTRARPPGPIRRLVPMVRRHRWAMSLLLGLVGFGIGGWLLRGDEADASSSGADSVMATRLVERGGRLEEWDPVLAVNTGDVLGVQLDLPGARHVRCFSLTGSAAGEWETIEPAIPYVVGEEGEQLALVRELASGQHRLVMTQVTKPEEDAGSGLEGLLLFVGREDPEWLARWSQAISNRVERIEAPISYRSAQDQLETILESVPRGEALSRWSPEERRRFLSQLSDEEIDDEDWPLEDPVRIVLSFRIEDS